MKLSILIKSAQQDAKADPTVVEWKGERCVLGRKEGDLRLVDRKCSRVHAVIYEDGGGLLRIRDLQSRNGIFVNGKKALDEAVTVGQEIKIGSTFIRILSHNSSVENRTEERCLNTGEIVGVGWPHQFTCMPPKEQKRLRTLIPGGGAQEDSKTHG